MQENIIGWHVELTVCIGRVRLGDIGLLGHAGNNAGADSDDLLQILLHTVVQGACGILAEAFIHLHHSPSNKCHLVPSTQLIHKASIMLCNLFPDEGSRGACILQPLLVGPLRN